VPQLVEAVVFDKALTHITPNAMQLFCDETGASLRPGSLGKKEEVGVWIGPEGGWTPEEVAAATQQGFALISLSKTTLRAETAAIVAAYLAVNS
jgi:16S rRNA (uracil1498-N3)-methyltransferase